MNRALSPLAAALLLAGCAATVDSGGAGSGSLSIPRGFGGTLVLALSSPHAKAADWETFKGEWRAAFRAGAERNGVAFESVEPGDKPKASSGTVVGVQVREYRYLTSGARYGFGIMTGNAFIDAGVTFTDIASGDRLGSRNFSTSSTAWQGVFSAMTDKQVAAIADEVLKLATAPARATTGAPQRTAGAAPLAAQPPIAEAVGQESYQVERMLSVKACNAQPRALLTNKGPGFETYTVACSAGDSLTVRCEVGACRVLR